MCKYIPSLSEAMYSSGNLLLVVFLSAMLLGNFMTGVRDRLETQIINLLVLPSNIVCLLAFSSLEPDLREATTLLNKV